MSSRRPAIPRWDRRASACSHRPSVPRISARTRWSPWPSTLPSNANELNSGGSPVLEDLASGREIAHATERLLRIAEADGRLPTPVEDLMAAAELRQPEESVLSDSAISQAPAHLRKAMAKL